MRRLILSGLLTVFFVALLFTTARADDTISVKFSFPTNELELSYRDGYVFFDIPFDKGYSYMSEPGLPMLPIRTARLVVPSNAHKVSIDVNSSSVSFDLPGKMYPAQEPLIIGEPGEFTPANDEFYSRDEWFPPVTHEPYSTGILRGMRVVNVPLYPVQYNPALEMYRVCTSMTVSVDVVETGDKLRAPARNFDTYANSLKRFVDNSEQVDAFCPTLTAPGTTALEGSAGDDDPAMGTLGSGDVSDAPDELDYLIITDSTHKPALDDLEQWRTRTGLRAYSVLTSSIYANYSGSDNQEKIRNCIIDFYTNKGISFVLLGGDQAVVPDRDSRGVVGSLVDYYDLPADYYYACLDGDWNSDGDSTYGESEDSPDYYAEVYVGRISSNSVTYTQNFVDKVINYEKNPPSSGFCRNQLFTGVELWNTYNGYSDYTYPVSDAETKGDDIYSVIEDNWEHADTDPQYKFYDTFTNWDSSTAGDYPLTDDNLTSKFNSPGFNFTMMLTHGNYNSWSMETGGAFYVNDAYQSNTTKPGIIYTMACLTNGFDYTFTSLSEAFLWAPNGGSVSYTGCSREGIGYVNASVIKGSSEGFAKDFFTSVFKDGDEYLGEAHINHKTSNAYRANSHDLTHYLMNGINLLGDPGMRMFTDNPSTFTVTHPERVNTGSVNVTVNAGVEGATVVISKGDDFYGTAVTGADGSATIAASFSTPGKADLSVVMQNYEPYLGTLYVNTVPEVSCSDGDAFMREGESLTVDVAITDPDSGQTVTVEVENLPPFASWNPVNSTITFNPNFLHDGQYSYSLATTDDFASQCPDYENGTATETFAISVGDVNRPPELSYSSTLFEATETDTVSFSTPYTDPDTDNTHDVTVAGLPDGATFDTNSMTFNWDTGFYDAGTYDITITVQDDSSTHYEPTGEDTDSVTITVTIANLNREPVIDPLSDMTVTEEELIDFVLSFDDPDADDTISLSVENAPNGASFDTSTGRFVWTPSKLQEGMHSDIRFSVNDGHVTVTESFSIEVIDVLPPDIFEAVTLDENGDGNVERVHVIFDEIVLPDSPFDPSSITVEGSSPYSVEFVGNYDMNLYFDPPLTGTGVMELSYTAPQSSRVFDTVGHYWQPFSDRALTDGATMVLLSALPYDDSGNGFTDRIVFTFSETLPPSAATLDGWEIYDSTGTVDVVAHCTSVEVSGNSLILYVQGDNQRPDTPLLFRYDGNSLTDSGGNTPVLDNNTSPELPVLEVLEGQPPSVFELTCDPVDPDQEPETMNYSWEFVRGPVPVTITNPTSYIAHAELLRPGEYEMRVTVSDCFGDSVSRPKFITVRNVAPVARVIGSIHMDIADEEGVILDASMSFDPNADPCTFSWNVPHDVTLDYPTSPSPVATFPRVGYFTATVTVTDPFGLSDTAFVEIIVFSESFTPPTAQLGPDRQAVAGNSVTLDTMLNGTGTPPYSVNWKQTNGPSVQIDTSEDGQRASFTPTEPGLYTLEVEVMDAHCYYSGDSVNIVVHADSDNNPPLADAGENQIRVCAHAITLDGTGSFDPDGDPLSYSWRVLLGPGEIENDSSPTPTFRPYGAGTYKIGLTVFDGTDRSVEDVITLHLTDGTYEPPAVSAGFTLPATKASEHPERFSVFGEYLEPPQSGEHYHIEQVGGPTVCFTPYNDTAQVRALRAGVYCFRVTLFDGEFVLQRIVYVPVYGPDEALALEEPEQPAEGYAGHEVHLNGPDGASHYLWVQLDGPACAKAHDSTGKTGSFYLPSSGEYTFMLYMSDGSSWTEPVSYKVNAVVGSPPSSGGGGCFVATAAFGSLTSDYVGALTAMRDGTLATSRTSSALVALYYSVSPAPSGSIRTSEPLRALLRDLLR